MWGVGERKEVRITPRLLSWETGKTEMPLTQMGMRKVRPFGLATTELSWWL